MTQHTRPHAHIAGGTAVTGTFLDDLIRPGLRLAFPVPTGNDSNEACFRRLLDALAQHRPEPRP